MAEIEILSGLSRIAGRYDALICDVWGVVHNSIIPYPETVTALRRFRRDYGPVILLTNAPRPAADVESQFARIGVPADCYDAIQTSGMAARDDLARRLCSGPVRMLHLGPERDRGVFAGLDVAVADDETADIVLCTGFFDDNARSPEDYRGRLTRLAARRLPLLCANPDILVPVGQELVYCAGALAQLYEALGGEVIYFGKPHRPVYDAAVALATRIAGRPIARPLAIGDGLKTDIAGANACGIDALFIAGDLHGAELGDVTPANVGRLFKEAGAAAIGAMPALLW